MSANDNQVGGEHYKNGYQHWDWVTNIAMGYLPAQVTKYLKRWRDKNGLEDLNKAAHFLDKMIEVLPILIYNVKQQRMIFPNGYIAAETDRYLSSNDITGLEAYICSALAKWETRYDLDMAKDYLNQLIDDIRKDDSELIEYRQAKELSRKMMLGVTTGAKE